MINGDPKQLFISLQGHIKNIDLTRQKSELLFSEGKIVKRDLHLIYKGLFLDFVTSSESFIEKLFVGLLIKKYEHPSKKVHVKQYFKSVQICRDIITGDRKYLDWLPYDMTTKRAKKYFRFGFPFAWINNSEIKTIEKVLVLRNVLAHESQYSRRKFHIMFIKDQNLLKYEKTVIGYLRSPISTTITQLRYEVLVNETLAILNKLVIKQV